MTGTMRCYQHTNTGHPTVAIQWTGHNLADVETFIRNWINPVWDTDHALNGDAITFTPADDNRRTRTVEPGQWIAIDLGIEDTYPVRVLAAERFAIAYDEPQEQQ